MVEFTLAEHGEILNTPTPWCVKNIKENIMKSIINENQSKDRCQKKDKSVVHIEMSPLHCKPSVKHTLHVWLILILVINSKAVIVPMTLHLLTYISHVNFPFCLSSFAIYANRSQVVVSKLLANNYTCSTSFPPWECSIVP